MLFLDVEAMQFSNSRPKISRVMEYRQEEIQSVSDLLLHYYSFLRTLRLNAFITFSTTRNRHPLRIFETS